MKMIKFALVAPFVAGTSGVALAQSPDDPIEPDVDDVETDIDVDDDDPLDDDTAAPPAYVIVDDDDDDGEPERIGFAIAAGGGVAGFTDEQLRDSSTAGGLWQVRATMGTRSPIAIEGSYIGSAEDFDFAGIDTDTTLISHGAQAALRLNATIDAPVQPFVYGGVAWRRYSLSNIGDTGLDIDDVDNVAEFPVGLGVAGRWQGLMLDVRGELRFATDEDLIPETPTEIVAENTNFAEMHRWGVTASVGYEL